MAWDRKSRMTFGLLTGLAVLVAGAGIFMPDIRESLIFKPRQGRAEAVVMQLAAHENRVRKGKGRFETFTPPQAAQRARALGLDTQDWPADDFLFDAALMPDKSLRLRVNPMAGDSNVAYRARCSNTHHDPRPRLDRPHPDTEALRRRPRAGVMEAFALGALVGLLLALTGAGGGILAVPLLVFALHLGVAEAAPKSWSGL